MDLRQLRYFVTVADERNFTRAAERLHMAQPPLSRQIQLLEADLKIELFDRAARPLRLTAMGHLFYEQAIQLLRRVEGLRSLMREAGASEKRRFVIGFVASTIYARLPGLIRQFRIAAPDVDLNMLEIRSFEQVAALKDGRIDVGFGRIRFDDPAIQRVVLREERLVAAVAATHPLAASSQPVTLARLAEERHILYPSAPRPSYADQVLSIFRDYGIEPDIAHEVRELQIAVGLVAAEEGICIVPESVRQSRTDDVRYVEIVEPVTSPIIMSHRIGDISAELAIMGQVIIDTYQPWGYGVPDQIYSLAQRGI